MQFFLADLCGLKGVRIRIVNFNAFIQK